MNNEIFAACWRDALYHTIVSALSLAFPLYYFVARRLEQKLQLSDDPRSKGYAICLAYAVGYVPIAILLLTSCSDSPIRFPIAGAWLVVGLWWIRREIKGAKKPKL